MRSRLSVTAEHVEALKALAHPGRLAVFFTLVQARDEMTVGAIRESVRVPGATLSRYLDQLRRAGLVRSRREERFIHYSVAREMVSQLVRLLTACC